MPEGFEKQVKPEEIADLLEFLTQRGKYLPMPLDKVATVVSTRGMFYGEDAAARSGWSSPTGGRRRSKACRSCSSIRRATERPTSILLYGPQGKLPPKMPRSVSLPCNAPAKAIHLLCGVSGWGYPVRRARARVSMIVRLHYADGQTEDHELKNGEHFADYIRRVDVPGSKFAFDLRGRQLRYLSVPVERAEPLTQDRARQGDDRTAPVVMAVTVETR